MKNKWLALSVLFIISTQVLGADLMSTFRDAVQNDPVLRAAGTTLLSQQQQLPQARSALRPQLNVDGNVTRNKIDNRTLSPIGSPIGVSYNSAHNFQASITQALLNLQAAQNIGLASYLVRAARVNYHAAKQDLIIRLARAYFDVLLAKDNLRFTGAELRANERQLDQAQQRFKVGLDAITTVYQAQASYDRVRADKIAAENAVLNTKEELRRITGKRYTSLKTLPNSVPLKTPSPKNVERWVDTATHLNKALVAARFNAVASRKNIRVQATANAPVLNLQGSYTDIGRNNPGINKVDTRNSTLAFQLAFPVFQGGLTIANTRQAEHDYGTALANVDDAYNAAVVTTRTSYNNIISGIGKIRADKQAIISANSALESTEAAFKVGTNTFVDVLEAQRNLYDAQRILSRDTYAYMNDILALKFAAGTLKLKDLRELNQWLYKAAGPSPITTSNKVDAQYLRKELKKQDEQKKKKKNQEKQKKVDKEKLSHRTQKKKRKS